MRGWVVGAGDRGRAEGRFGTDGVGSLRGDGLCPSVLWGAVCEWGVGAGGCGRAEERFGTDGVGSLRTAQYYRFVVLFYKNNIEQRH